MWAAKSCRRVTLCGSSSRIELDMSRSCNFRRLLRPRRRSSCSIASERQQSRTRTRTRDEDDGFGGRCILPFQIRRCCLAVVILLSGFGADSVAQLAITEVMSASKPNTNTSFRGAEYWELTNFGTNDMNLHGYGFRDADPTHTAVKEPFTNLVVRAGESVIFFRPDDSITTISQFRSWWGTGKLPADLQIRLWTTFGLSGWDGDAVLLFDAVGRLVDSVQFGRARRGRSFSYSPETGLFGSFSTLRVDGAFAADLADDVGSPGTTTGPVPVQILQQPADQVTDAGSTATLSGLAGGMPVPRYQWFFQNVPIAGGTNALLVITNIQSQDAGSYYFRATNGWLETTSTTATLTVNTNPTPPSIISAPADQTVYEGQTAVFTVVARGLPAVAYQWQANGNNVPDGTTATLKVQNVTEALSGTRYSVRISNSLGVTNASALLTITRRPDLRFTEVMALPVNEKENRHFDWFELTNFDTNTVNLFGWRFSDDHHLSTRSLSPTYWCLSPVSQRFSRNA